MTEDEKKLHLLDLNVSFIHFRVINKVSTILRRETHKH